MSARPLNNNTIRLTDVFYREEGPSFQHVIEELFKTYKKSCGSSYTKGEPI